MMNVEAKFNKDNLRRELETSEPLHEILKLIRKLSLGLGGRIRKLKSRVGWTRIYKFSLWLDGRILT